MQHDKAADVIRTRDLNEDVHSNIIQEFIIETGLFGVFDQISNVENNIVIQRLSMGVNVCICF